MIKKSASKSLLQPVRILMYAVGIMCKHDAGHF